MSAPTWVHVPPLSAYTRTWPASVPVPSLSIAPIATRVPSEDIDTEYPDQSSAASPSMSAPTWVHVPPLSAYTRTCPALLPVPSLYGAPIATRVPSEDIDTESPDQSAAASPSMSAPTWVHVPPLSAYTRTWPASVPVPSLRSAPIATRVPSADIDTDPDQSSAASPSMSAPTWDQFPPLSTSLSTRRTADPYRGSASISFRARCTRGSPPDDASSTDATCCAAKRAPLVCPPSMPAGAWSRALAPTTSAASIASASIARWTNRGIPAGPSRAPRATICPRPFDPWA